MKAIIFACKYSKTIPYFAQLWNKYYDSNMEVIVLSPTYLPVLPNNFKHFKLSNFSRSWVNDISEFFDRFTDEYFFSTMDDHFLYSSVQRGVLIKAERIIQSNNNVCKFGCRIGPINQIPRWALDTPDIQFSRYNDTFCQPCPVRASLMPSIWRTEFFKLLLDHSKDYTAWEFELRPKTKTPYELEPEIREKIKDKRFLFSEIEPFPCIDLIRGGQDNYNEWSKLVKEDIEIFSSARKAVF